MKRIVLLFCLLVFSVLSAQMPLQINLTTPMGTYFNLFYPANFNPDEPNSQPIFFMLDIVDVSGTFTGEYNIQFTLEWNGNLAETVITPDDFSLPLALDNQDFINRDPVGLDVSGASSFDNILDAIEQYILDTGRIPDGNYFFTFTAFDNVSGEQISAPATLTLTIQAPIAIGLITPGGPLSLPAVPISSQNPEFIWFSNLTDYHFALFDLKELGENVAVSAENIELLEPYFEADINSTSLSYPSGAKTLEEGGSYAWRVTAPINIPLGSGVEEYSSVFYMFTISTSGGEQTEEIILNNFLNQIPGNQAQIILNYLNSGYELEEIVWQGEVISIDELLDILQQIANGELEVKE